MCGVEVICSLNIAPVRRVGIAGDTIEFCTRRFDGGQCGDTAIECLGTR
jgi:hypothetical protein